MFVCRGHYLRGVVPIVNKITSKQTNKQTTIVAEIKVMGSKVRCVTMQSLSCQLNVNNITRVITANDTVVSLII